MGTGTTEKYRSVVGVFLQAAIAALAFLFISIMGQTFFASALGRLNAAGMIPDAVMGSYFWTGIMPEVILNCISVIVLIILFHIFQKRNIREMGLAPVGKNVGNIVRGIGISMALLSCITLVLLLTGNIAFTGLTWNVSIFQYFLQMASVSLVEETLNRGFIQRVVRNKLGVIASILVPSFIFMLFHIGNTSLSLLNIFLAGVCFSVITYKTGNIWCAFGAHLIWNVGSACIFGLMGVSEATGSILNFDYLTQNLFNGYGASPLAGLIGTIGWTVTILLMILFMKPHKNRNFVV